VIARVAMSSTADAFPPLDFDVFHRVDLSARCTSAAGRAAARDTGDAAPIAFRLPDGRAYRFSSTGEEIEIAPGDHAPVVVDLDASAWADFVRELHTAAGLFYGGHLRRSPDVYPALERWEPALRALFCGRPIYDPARCDLRGRDGSALEIGRSFAPDDETSDLRDFLHATGYLHVRSVFDRGEIARLVALVERFEAAARPGDGTSWWTKRGDGAGDVLCRLIYLGMRAPEVAALDADPRIARFASLGGEPLVSAVDRADGHTVVIKVPGAVAGLADLPWHRDCGLGGHPVTCPTLIVGIQLDAASAGTGQLKFLAGSWRASCHRRDLERAAGAIAAIVAEPGDVTVHFGDVLHAAPPPTGTGRGRRTLYFSFVPPRALEFIGPLQSYNDVIRARVGG